MREPVVSQKIARVEKCSHPSLPRGNRFSNSARLRPSANVRHHFRASRTESERKISIRVSNTCASCVVGFDMKQETVSEAMRPSHRAVAGREVVPLPPLNDGDPVKIVALAAS